LSTYSKHIRIAVDCRDLFIAKTGSKTYLSEFIQAATQLYQSDTELVQLYPIVPLIKLNGKLGKLIKHLQFFFWKQISLPLLVKLKNCDVLICTDYFLPSIKFNVKHIAVFHDAFFWEYPEHYGTFWLKLFHAWAVPSAKNAEVILTPSQYVKSRLIHFMDVGSEKISVVYEAPKSFINDPNKGTSTDFSNCSPYLLHVGALNKHKNLPRLIKAFKLAIAASCESWHLILVGGKVHSSTDDDSSLIIQTIHQEGLFDRVHLIGHVQDKELVEYYKNAKGYIFPSYNEGFGLPMLEAMKFNLPIAAANNTSLPEIGGNGAIYFDPFNINEIARAIRQIIEREKIVKDSLAQQPTVLSSYSWEKAALEITAICKAIS
jgi:glycosyltransferase involved in cell wall biosynthesis